jgi:hypothetical protein
VYPKCDSGGLESARAWKEIRISCTSPSKFKLGPYPGPRWFCIVREAMSSRHTSLRWRVSNDIIDENRKRRRLALSCEEFDWKNAGKALENLEISTGFRCDGPARFSCLKLRLGEMSEFLLADRTQGRGAIRLGLRAALHGLAQQVLDILGGLSLQMPKVLIAGGGESLDRMFQPTSRARREDRERFGRSSTLDGWIDRLKTSCIHAPSLHYPARN